MNILHTAPKGRISAALFDFDGTISTLRCGWEDVMAPLMEETLLACGRETIEEIAPLVRAYIDQSTGIQTIFQMKWLAEQVAARGATPLDSWQYKDMYNERLMRRVEEKKSRLRTGAEQAESYLMAGAADFLRALRERGVAIYAASGTDDEDVVEEAKLLRVFDLFDDIKGAPYRQEKCPKEAALTALMGEHGLKGGELAVLGDGKVELTLGAQVGARTVGIASDEARRSGVNPVKYARLEKAGAGAICGDFLEKDALMSYLGLSSIGGGA